VGLTALAIKAAKGRDKQYKLADSGGLHLLVLPSGGRYWRMNDRHMGKYRHLVCGPMLSWQTQEPSETRRGAL
jgi:hypothetical protein